MANEWTKVELYGANNDGEPRRYTIADGTAVSKGQLLQLTDPRTVTAKTAALQACAGVASMEKKASDGSTSISCWTNGIFEATASLAIAVGNPVVGVDRNKVNAAPAIASGAQIIGYALETATAGETINVRLRL